MRNQIAILGSTGSIGISTLNIIRKNKKKFKIKLLSANSNSKLLLKQAKEFDVKAVVLSNLKNNTFLINQFKKQKIKIYDNYFSLNKILKKKIDYTINAISGIDGLLPTLKIIKHTKKIAIANKESIICGWNLINNQLKKNKTKFIPVDSEHFSINELIKDNKFNRVKNVIITASGGPFLKKKITKNIKIKEALNHPNWSMGKKITIDSSTLMNKVFEVIEAKKIFNLKIKDIKILINPNSYVHSIIVFNNGIIKFLAHDPKMDIPIFNSIYDQSNEKFYSYNKLKLNKINKLNLSVPDAKKFKLLKILKLVPEKDSLFETILVSINDELVNLFLNKKIKYNEIANYIIKIINSKKLKKYYKKTPFSLQQIYNIRNLSKNFVKEFIKK